VLGKFKEVRFAILGGLETVDDGDGFFPLLENKINTTRWVGRTWEVTLTCFAPIAASIALKDFPASM
jgi:hypothetical protein